MNNKIAINNQLFHKLISLKQEKNQSKKSLGNKFFMHHTTDVEKLIEIYVKENNENGRLSGQYKYGQEWDLSQVKKDCMSDLKSLRGTRKEMSLYKSGYIMRGTVKKQYKLLVNDFFEKEYNGFIQIKSEEEMTNTDGAKCYNITPLTEEDKANIESSLREFMEAVIYARNSIDEGKKVNTVKLRPIHPHYLEAYIENIVPTLEAFQSLYEDLEFELQPGKLIVRKKSIGRHTSKQKNKLSNYNLNIIVEEIKKGLQELVDTKKKKVEIDCNKPKSIKKNLEWQIILANLINDIRKSPEKILSKEMKESFKKGLSLYLKEENDKFTLILTHTKLSILS